jgi:hypothetical protein
VILSGAFDQDLTVYREEKGGAHSEAMFPARFTGEACRWRALAAFRRPLSDGEATTRYRAMGGA